MREPDDYDEPQTPQEMSFNASVCGYCHELLNQEHSIMDVINHHTCMLDGSSTWARLCWEAMKRMGVTA